MTMAFVKVSKKGWFCIACKISDHTFVKLVQYQSIDFDSKLKLHVE